MSRMITSLLGAERPKGSTSSPDAAVWRRAAWLLLAILAACGAALAVASSCSAEYPTLLRHTLVSFALGLRHAVDCDHLAAIDNVTRQLLLKGQTPVSVGFWFAVGHSTIVLLLTAVIAGGYSWASTAINQDSHLAAAISLVAACISIALLGGVGLLNASIASGLYSEWSRLRRGDAGDREVGEVREASLRTALSSIPLVRRVFDRVDRPFKMYGVGFLFGLSFDSASQVGLIGLTAMSGTSGRAPAAFVMLFPVAFSCGMCLVDTANGLLMLTAYTYSMARPSQQLLYNFVVTSMSAGVALAICSLEVLQIAAEEGGLRGALWDSVRSMDMVAIGLSVIASFALVLGVSVLCTKGALLCAPKRAESQAEYIVV